MNTSEQARFNLLYQSYLNELILQGKSEKTIDGYSRCLRQIASFFDTSHTPMLTLAEVVCSNSFFNSINLGSRRAMRPQSYPAAA